MTVFLHWRDDTFPAGDGERANTRKAAFETAAEALEQAAHDLAFHGAEIAHLINDKGKDVLDRKKLLARAHELIDDHHGQHIAGLEAQLEAQRAHVASVKADIERRVG